MLVVLQALLALRRQTASQSAWHLEHYSTDGCISASQQTHEGALVACCPRRPANLADAPEALSRSWLGERLHAVSQHMQQYDFGEACAQPTSRCVQSALRCPGMSREMVSATHLAEMCTIVCGASFMKSTTFRTLLHCSWQCVCRANRELVACRLSTSEAASADGAADQLRANAATQSEFVHTLEVHDVGCYRFKGVAFDFSIKSLNLGALRGRNVDYQAPLKASKAKKTSEGRGLEKVRPTHSLQAYASCTM